MLFIFLCNFFTYWHFYNWFIFKATLFQKGRIAYILLIQWLQNIYAQSVTELSQRNFKPVQCDCCDKWVHIACNYPNAYTYRKSKKDKSPWYCLCQHKKEISFCCLKNEPLQELGFQQLVLLPYPYKSFLSFLPTE